MRKARSNLIAQHQGLDRDVVRDGTLHHDDFEALAEERQAIAEERRQLEKDRQAIARREDDVEATLTTVEAMMEGLVELTDAGKFRRKSGGDDGLWDRFLGAVRRGGRRKRPALWRSESRRLSSLRGRRLVVSGAKTLDGRRGTRCARRARRSSVHCGPWEPSGSSPRS